MQNAHTARAVHAARAASAAHAARVTRRPTCVTTYSYASGRKSLTFNPLIWTPLIMKNKKNTNINILSCIIYEVNNQEEPSLFNNETMSLYK